MIANSNKNTVERINFRKVIRMVVESIGETNLGYYKKNETQVITFGHCSN